MSCERRGSCRSVARLPEHVPRAGGWVHATITLSLCPLSDVLAVLYVYRCVLSRNLLMLLTDLRTVCIFVSCRCIDFT